jgi:hypothetical protein
MHRPEIHRCEIRDGGTRPKLAVDAVARFERDLLAFANLDYRRNVGVVPIVTTIRFVAEPLASIDMDRVHLDFPRPAAARKRYHQWFIASLCRDG